MPKTLEPRLAVSAWLPAAPVVQAPSPPISRSAAEPPVRTLALRSPARLFAAVAEPRTFSTPESTSPWASPPDWAFVDARSMLTPAVEAV
ncbi:hypothetical protein SLNSH_24010 [Alsobacter soli]|uniref:Uncharacterized protein n=1 Tax=Alsobacter soli TaxID=2109933 RepID=A0A2T1HLB7_9HYPH|nr:hypothetical protein SLNSH_24010 [Alsobacter soli]